jgi:hypothetical protein
MPVTVGGAAVVDVYVKALFDESPVLSALEVRSQTSMVAPFWNPGAGGATAVILVSEITVKRVAGLGPNNTAVVPVNLLPVIVIWVPAGPLFGEIPVISGTVGAAVGIVVVGTVVAVDVGVGDCVGAA